MELVKLIKKAASEVNETSCLTDIRIGTIINTKPLTIKMSEKLILGEKQLLQCKTVYNKLKINDKVVIIRKTGGQSFFIIDWLEEK